MNFLCKECNKPTNLIEDEISGVISIWCSNKSCKNYNNFLAYQSKKVLEYLQQLEPSKASNDKIMCTHPKYYVTLDPKKHICITCGYIKEIK